MPETYTLIQKFTIGATSAERITFTNIPQGYTDLKIVGSVRSESPNPYDFIYGYINGVSGSHYPVRYIQGDGSAVTSSSSTATYSNIVYVNGNGATANTFGNFEMYFPNYSGSSQKTFSLDSVTETNSSAAYQFQWAGSYTNGTSAITSIVLASGSGYFRQHSTFYLYGITKQGVTTSSSSAAYATGGDTITTDGTYWYHAFRTSGTFTPRKVLSCDVLVIAGGAGSSQHQGGGGGAGGLLGYTSQSLIKTNYNVTVGAGGAGVTSGAPGGNGSNSQFASLTASVGGGGGGMIYGNGQNGGSGGGGGGFNTGDSSVSSGGTGTSGQGNNGGTGTGSNGATTGWRAGGGGGAGSVGGNAASASTSGQSGNGGAGVNTYSSWASATGTGVSGFYAGGGAGGGNSGGGTGGSGGGGNGGGTSTSGSSGTAGTGSGAGGAGNGSVAANGGSGIVIVRYPV